jgi:hypothetical protein
VEEGAIEALRQTIEKPEREALAEPIRRRKPLSADRMLFQCPAILKLDFVLLQTGYSRVSKSLAPSRISTGVRGRRRGRESPILKVEEGEVCDIRLKGSRALSEM